MSKPRTVQDLKNLLKKHSIPFKSRCVKNELVELAFGAKLLTDEERTSLTTTPRILKVEKSTRSSFNLPSPIEEKSGGLALEDVNKFLDAYIAYNKIIEEINVKTLKNKKCRRANFPSEISENICRMVMSVRYGMGANWNTESGDLTVGDKKIEVKGFISNGPSSFGPAESWDYICFVDATQYESKIFKVYEIKLSNTSEEWTSIKLTKTSTVKTFATSDKRGKLRGCFNTIFKPQLGDKCNLIFQGTLADASSKASVILSTIN